MGLSNSRVYVVSLTRVAVTLAKTLIQIKAGAAGLQILRIMVDQTSSVTPTKLPLQLCRKSAAGTVTTFTPLKVGPQSDPSSLAVGGTAATGTDASAEGTDSDIVMQGVLEYANGFLWVASPKDMIYVPPSGIVGLKLPVAPGASVTLTADIYFEEIG